MGGMVRYNVKNVRHKVIQDGFDKKIGKKLK